MCGRFALFSDPDTHRDYFEAEAAPMEWSPRYNIAPTQPVLACRLNPATGNRELVPLRWGLVPAWSRDLADGVKAINARAETVADKPTFRAAFKSRRCLIPASGYYEWKREGKSKQPHFIHPRGGGVFAFAGLWELWSRGDESAETCSILTTTANEATRRLHERMPVILDRADFAAWLDPLTPPPALHELLRPCPPERVALYSVGAAVGNVRNDGPELVAPAADLFTA
jgi:putative SOS response-associated peptidase YedK